MFQMDSPLMKLLTKIGNMILVSLYWLVACVPLVTVIPACAALFHTVTKVIRADGEGVTRDFFSAFRQALNPGIFLSLLAVGGGLLLYTCVDFGRQMMQRHVAGTAYFAVGCVLCFVWAATVLYLAPALSRFEGGVLELLRIAFYLPSRNFFHVLWMLVLLAVLALAVDFYPVLLLIAPALYADLTCSGAEKALQKLLAASGAADAQAQAEEGGEARSPEEDAGFSALEQAAQLEEPEE